MSISAGAYAAIAGGTAALQAGGQIASSAMSNRIRYGQAKKLNEQMFNYQKELNADANEYQKAMLDYTYQKDIEYNSPAAQMARFKEAGLNPNLIYGQSNSANGSAVSGQFNAPNQFNPAQYHETPPVDLSGLTSALGDYFSIKSLAADTKQKEEAVKGQEISNAIQETELLKKLSEDDGFTFIGPHAKSFTPLSRYMGAYEYNYNNRYRRTSEQSYKNLVQQYNNALADYDIKLSDKELKSIEKRLKNQSYNQLQYSESISQFKNKLLNDLQGKGMFNNDNIAKIMYLKMLEQYTTPYHEIGSGVKGFVDLIKSFFKP